jgi:hypothetical protein
VKKERFLQMVQRFQEFITISIISGIYSNNSIENALRVLDVFNESNESKLQKDKIHYKDFYNDAINKEVSLKEHIS